jgi:hypothetical protein
VETLSCHHTQTRRPPSQLTSEGVPGVVTQQSEQLADATFRTRDGRVGLPDPLPRGHALEQEPLVRGRASDWTVVARRSLFALLGDGYSGDSWLAMKSGMPVVAFVGWGHEENVTAVVRRRESAGGASSPTWVRFSGSCAVRCLARDKVGSAKSGDPAPPFDMSRNMRWNRRFDAGGIASQTADAFHRSFGPMKWVPDVACTARDSDRDSLGDASSPDGDDSG